MRIYAHLVGCVAGLIGLALLSISPPAEARVGSSAPSQWSPEVAKIDALLQQGKWKPGKRKAHKLAEEIIGESWYGRGLRRVLAELAFLQAVGSANLGERDEAIWYWHIAQNVDHRIRDKDLAPYGEAGKLLREFPLRRRGQAPPAFKVVDPGICRDCNFPRLAERWSPAIPPNAGKAAEQRGDLQVEIIVDREGRPSHPVVLSRDFHPVAVYGALEALRSMPRFKPAHNYGEPVDTLYKFHLDLKQSRWEQGRKLGGRIEER